MSEGNEYRPAVVSPPGATILDLICLRGWTVAEFVKRSCLNEAVVHRLLDGEAPLMPNVAVVLQKLFDTPAAFWLRREEQYQAWRAQQPEEEDAPEHTEEVETYYIELEVRRRRDGNNHRFINGFLDNGTFQSALNEIGVEVTSVIVKCDP